MKATSKKQITPRISETMEGIWSSGLGALQHSTTMRGSHPEIYDGTGGKMEEVVKQSCFFDKRVKHEPWEVEQIERKNTTKMNKVENAPLEKRDKGFDENQEV